MTRFPRIQQVGRTLLVLVAAMMPLVLGACQTPRTSDPDIALHPTQHADFGHYTFALTWQPGFCAAKPACLADQPREPLIGLHGLWASRPQALIAADVAPPVWWSKGCDYFGSQPRVAPHMSDATASDLSGVVAHFADPLVTHEYVKHVACFGLDADRFFRAALVMRGRIATSDFGRMLISDTGRTVSKAELLTAFAHDRVVASASGTVPELALQFRCEKDQQGHPILAQLWFTVRPDGLNTFPAVQSLMTSPQEQDNCPANFQVPNWG